MTVSPAELTPQQRAELIKSFADHETFCRSSLRLRERSGSLVPFEFWPSQKKLAAVVRRQQKQGKPVRILVLKTRRSGFTMASCGHIFREVAFFPGRRGTVIADKYDPAALEAFGYLKTFAGSYVPFGPPGAQLALPDLHVAEADLKIRRGDETILDVYSGDRGEIRGGGRHWLLFDEFAFMRAAGITIRSAANMVPDLPDTGIIIQSTANGQGGEFWEMCNRAHDPALSGGFELVFFGWLEDENNRRPFDSPDDAARLQRSLDSEERVLHNMHSATLEQLNWRRWKIRTNFNGRVDDFHQEYPTTPAEAFLTTGRPALDQAMLAQMPVSPGQAGEVQLIEVPPRKRVLFLAREHGAVTIWQQPIPGAGYVIGADPSRGIDVSESKRGDDPDFSVGFVIDRDTGTQVALLRERLRPAAFAEYLALLGRLFNDAYLVPEANDAGFIDALIRTGYPLHLIYNRQRMPDDLRPPQAGEIGYETNTVSRTQLVAAIDEAVRSMAITIRSPIVLQECRTFVIKPNGKAEHQTGCHDDCVIAAALAVIGLRTAPVARKLNSKLPAGVTRYGQGRKSEDD